MGRSPGEYLADADLVFLGRAEPPSRPERRGPVTWDASRWWCCTRSRGRSRRAERYVQSRSATVMSTCDSDFAPGEARTGVRQEQAHQHLRRELRLSVVAPKLHEYLAACTHSRRPGSAVDGGLPQAPSRSGLRRSCRAGSLVTVGTRRWPGRSSPSGRPACASSTCRARTACSAQGDATRSAPPDRLSLPTGRHGRDRAGGPCNGTRRRGGQVALVGTRRLQGRVGMPLSTCRYGAVNKPGIALVATRPRLPDRLRARPKQMGSSAVPVGSLYAFRADGTPSESALTRPPGEP